MAISLLSVFGFNTVLTNTTFNAQTEIKPITSFELDKYRLFNASLKRLNSENIEIKIFNISSESLLKLYIEQIEEGTLLESGWEFGKVYLEEKRHCDCGAPVFELAHCSGCGTSSLNAEELVVSGGKRQLSVRIGELLDDYADEVEQQPDDSEQEGVEDEVELTKHAQVFSPLKSDASTI